MQYQFHRHGIAVSSGINDKFLEVFRHFYSNKPFTHPLYSMFNVDAIHVGLHGKAMPGPMITYFEQFKPDSYSTLAQLIPDDHATLFIEFNTVFSLTDQQRDQLFNSNRYKVIVDDSFETNLYRAEALRETFIELYGHSPIILNNGVYKNNSVSNEIKRNHWLVLNQYGVHLYNRVPGHDHEKILSYENKKFKALSINGHTTVFRAKLLGLLAKNNLIKSDNTGEVLYSCRNNTHAELFQMYSGLNADQYLPKIIENDNLVDLSVDPCLRTNPGFFWEDTFFKINMETNHFWHNDDLVMLTEKWLKSILYLKPSFTLCEQSGMDAHVESLGFDIYRDFINRDYDSVLDCETRIHSFIDSFKSTEIPSVNNWKVMGDIARSNYNHLVTKYIPKLEEDFLAAIG